MVTEGQARAVTSLCLMKAGAVASLALVTLCHLERKWSKSCRAEGASPTVR